MPRMELGRQALHTFKVWLVVTSMLCLYAVLRLGTLRIRDAEARKAAVARLEGRMLRSTMARLGACFVKLGQVMSTRPDLFHPAIIDELRTLQDNLPPFDFAIVRRTLEQALGKRLEDVFAELDETPLAAASVAQVHRGRLKDGREVAVKVLRPGVHEQVERDGAVLLLNAKLAALHPEIRLSDPVGFTQTFVDGLLAQTDLRTEARNYQRFRHNFAHDARIAFPAVYEELSSEKVLVMELVRGTKLDALGPGDHRELARTLREATYQMCLVDGFMHADLHPGNMVRRDDGVLVLFDVGLATDLAPNTRDLFADLCKCIAIGGPDDFVEHLKRYHVYLGDVDWGEIHAELEAFSKTYRGKGMADVDYGAMTKEMMEITRRHHVRPQPDLALIVVGTVTAQGIGKMLCPGLNDFAEMAKYIVPLLMKRDGKLPDTDAARAAASAAALGASSAA